MLWIKRAAALLFSFALIISSGVPALAVTPQEGWFIRDIETVDGIEYYVIDNKMSDDDWWVDLTSTWINSDTPLWTAANGNILQPSAKQKYGLLTFNEAWRGYDQYSWRVDSDWLVRFCCTAIGSTAKSGQGVTVLDDFSIKFCAIDRSMAPLFLTDSETTSGTGVQIGGSPTDSLLFTGSDSGTAVEVFDISGFELTEDSLGARRYFTMESFTYSLLWNDYEYDEQPFYTYRSTIDLDGCDINDLVFFVAPVRTGWGLQGQVNARCSIQLMCPKDKAPSGMSIGDYWPKVRPLEVAISDAYDPYYKAMLANGQIKDPSDINTMFGQLGGMQEQGLGALEIGDAESGFFTAAVSMMQPLFLTLLPIIGVGVILIIFANKGMHG